MKFLTSGMADLKLRLLYRIAQARKTKAPSKFSSVEAAELHRSVVCQAVEDRIGKRIDLATRTDLTDQQAIDALRLLIGIVRRSALPIDFSPLEIALVTRGNSYRMRSEPMPKVFARAQTAPRD